MINKKKIISDWENSLDIVAVDQLEERHLLDLVDAVEEAILEDIVENTNKEDETKKS